MDTERHLLFGVVENKERYSLTHLHAKGGMGRVWLARDTSLDRQIALKELRPDQANNSTVYSRFLYEAKITAQLEHPGIVPVYEVGDGKVPYYTMRFVQGRTLSQAIRSYHKKRAAGEANSGGLVELVTAFVGVCHAVAYAHSRGVIHRDLKGQNVILGKFGEVLVLDWGLAKRVGSDSCKNSLDEVAPAGVDEPAGGSRASEAFDGEGTLNGQLLGTPAFMAPEQARGCHDLVDERSDVYGLGAILYEVLTGRPPFIGPKPSDVIQKVCHEPPTPPRQIVANTALRFAALEAVCLKALEKLPERRYRSALELTQEVQRWLADEPVQAFTEPWTARTLRWVRRHKTMVSAAMVLLVTATVALAVSTVLIAREAKEAEVQGEQARQAVHLLTKVSEIGFDDKLDPIQKQFLEGALAYYEQFTGRVSDNLAVKLEHGRAYQQMGDIKRKLGQLAESERAYRQAVLLLEPLASDRRAVHAAKQSLAETYTLLGNLLVRRGGAKDEIVSLYAQAVRLQQALASLHNATSDDLLRLGQSFKSQADLLRLDGQFSQAQAVYDKALSTLERAHAADNKQSEIRHDLALAADARGLVYRELGNLDLAKHDLEHAQNVLDALVTDFPTVPRYREALAKACNSLGLLEQDAGRLASAEGLIRRELPLVERLAQDYPDRPEHHRQLARALYNLGIVLLAQNRTMEAEPLLQRAVAVTTAIAKKYPDDVQIRFDLAKCHQNLGELLLEKGDTKAAVASLLQERLINESLVRAFPDRPRYSSVLATNLASLAFALQTTEPAKVELTYNAALGIYEKLVTAYPDNVEYRIGHARCLRNFGPVLAAAGKSKDALAVYQRALALLQTKDAAGRKPEWLLNQAEVLNNLGDLLRTTDQPNAEATLRRTVAIFQGLAVQPQSSHKVRHNLAIAQYNLGDLLVDLQRFKEAEVLTSESVAGFEALIADAPASIECQSEFGLILQAKGDLLTRRGEHVLAKAALADAVAHQRMAVKLSKNRSDTRALLGRHLLALADLNIKLGEYRDAAASALDVPSAVPASHRAQGCLDAARSLARLLTHAATDQKLAAGDREQLSRSYLGRTVVLLREVIDSRENLIEEIRTDPDIKQLESRPEFQVIMNTLVNFGK
jgi:serine/threonine protein kinase